MCVYIEIDTVVPEKPEFEFLRKNNFRIRTVTLRGQISQGLALPLSVLPTGDYKIGDDVTNILEITHYTKPIPVGMGDVMRQAGLPFNIPQTDERMLQSIPDILTELMGLVVYISTKLDGTSATYAIKDKDYHVCSRGNSWFEDDKSLYWNVSKMYNIQDKLLSMGKNLAIQGEICGPGIQKNRLDLKHHDLFVFDVFDIDKYEYFGYDQLCEFCQHLGFIMVPVECVLVFDYNLPELIYMAKGNYKSGKKKEGIVIRAINNNVIGRLSFKVLNNDYDE